MIRKILFTLTATLIILSIYMVFFIAPIPNDIHSIVGDPNSFKIFYFHVPIDMAAYLSFAIVFVSSILYLRSKQQKWDILALSAAEVGVVFTFLILATGSIWAKSAWGVYWITGDVLLMTSLVLFLIYISYLTIRQAIDEPEKRARLSAVFGVVGFIGVPLSYMSIRLAQKSSQLKPMELHTSSSSPLFITLLMNIAAFFLLALSLILLRMDNEKLKEQLNEIKRDKDL